MHDERRPVWYMDIYELSFIVLLIAKAFGFLQQTWIFVLLPLVVKIFMKFGRSWLDTIAEDIIRARDIRRRRPVSEQTEVLEVVSEQETEKEEEKQDTPDAA